MMHVPVDVHLAKANDKVRIFGAYHREALGVARDTARIQPFYGSAAVALEIFTREKIGVETATLADSFCSACLMAGCARMLFISKNVAEAAQALLHGTVAAVLAPRSSLRPPWRGSPNSRLRQPICLN